MANIAIHLLGELRVYAGMYVKYPTNTQPM